MSSGDRRFIETIALILTGIGLLALIFAQGVAFGDPQGFELLIATILAMFQLVCYFIALPFIYKAIQRQLIHWFNRYITTVSLLNALIILTIGLLLPATPLGIFIFFTAAVIELLPIWFIYQQRNE